MTKKARFSEEQIRVGYWLSVTPLTSGHITQHVGHCYGIKRRPL